MVYAPQRIGLSLSYTILAESVTEVEMLKIKILSLLGIFLLFTLAAYAAEEEPIGIVIGIQGRVIVKNSSSAFPLALKSPLAVSDTVTTGFNSKVLILLRDDSAITLGEDSELELSEFSDIGVSPNFSANFVNGSLRIITGKIVEANPEGFKITTQHATVGIPTVGIRGTILNLRTDDQRTKLVVLNTDKTVIFNSVSVSENQWAVAERGGTPVISPLTRQEKEEEIRDMIVAPITEPVTESDDASAAPTPAAPTPAAEAGDSFAEIPDIQYTPDIPFTPPDNPTPPIITTAIFEGSVGDKGVFSFNMDIFNGAITEAKTNGSYGGVLWNLSGGSGEFCRDGSDGFKGFEVRNFDGTASNGVTGVEFDSLNTHFESQSAYDGAIDGTFQLGMHDPTKANSEEKIYIPVNGGQKQ
jgi:hypothetical protein